MRRKTVKKLFSVLLAGTMALSLAACGDGSGKDTEKAAVPETAAKEETEAAKTKASEDGDVVLEFWDMPWGSVAYQEAAQALVKRFNEEHPGITVNYTSVPWDGDYQTFNVAITSGNAPDVSTGSGYSPFQFDAMGEILPLDDLMEEMKADGSADFEETAMKQFVQNGHQVAMPWNLDPKCIYYRKDILEENNIPVPTTWDELLDACKQLSDGDFYGMAIESAGAWPLNIFLINNGVSFIDENKQAAFTSDGVKETLEYFRTLSEEKVIAPGSAGYTAAEAQKLFLQGKAAFIPTSADFANSIKDQGEEFYNNVELLAPLTAPSGTSLSIMGCNGIMAYQQTEHPDEAKMFIRWWLENSDTLWTEGGMGAFPALRTKYTLDVFTQDKFKAALIEKVLPVSVPLNYPSENAFPAMNSIQGELLTSQACSMVLGTDKPVEDIMNEINEKVITILDSFGTGEE